MWLLLATTEVVDLTDVGLSGPARERLDAGLTETMARFQTRLPKLVQEAAESKG